MQRESDFVFFLWGRLNNSLQASFNVIAESLLGKGFSITDHALPATMADSLRALALLAWEEGNFKKAKIGKGIEQHRNTEIRGDAVQWWTRGHIATPQEEYWNGVDALREYLANFFRVSMVRTELHFAAYPPGAFYKKHLDQFAGQSDRIFSVILYLNPGWVQDHGGALRIYTDTGSQDIAPAHNRLVVFRSDAVPHEVLPTHSMRYSVTGWMRRDELLPL